MWKSNLDDGFRKLQNREDKGSGLRCAVSRMHCTDDVWIADRVAAHLMNRSNPTTVLDALAALLRRRFPFVEVVDGPGDGGVDIVAARVGRTILVQVKHWSKPLRPCHVREIVEKIQANYLVDGSTQVWAVNKSGFSFPESKFDWGLPLKLWKTRELIRELAPPNLIKRIDRERRLRIRGMDIARRRR